MLSYIFEHTKSARLNSFFTHCAVKRSPTASTASLHFGFKPKSMCAAETGPTKPRVQHHVQRRSHEEPGSAEKLWKFQEKHKRHVKPPIHQVVKPSYFQSICNIRVLGPHDLAIGFALKCDTCSCNKHQAAGSDFRSLSTSKRDI